MCLLHAFRSSPALALRIHFNQEMAHGLSQAPCTLQLAATALPLLTGAVPVLHVQLPPGRLQRQTEAQSRPSPCHSVTALRDNSPTYPRATLRAGSLSTAKQKLMPLRTTLAQVNLLEYSNRICKTRTWIPGLVPLHESKVGPLGLGEPSMGEAWTQILGAFRGAWLEVASPTSPTEAV